MSKNEDEKDLDMENDTWNDGELLSVQFIFMMFFLVYNYPLEI